jgi:hypothetical protein
MNRTGTLQGKVVPGVCCSCRWVRMYLWTAVTNGPIVHPPDDIWALRATLEWYWQGKAEELGEKPVLVTLRSPKIPHGMTRTRTPAYAARWRQWIALMMGGSTHLWNVSSLQRDTRRYIPEDSKLHTRRRVYLKSYLLISGDEYSKSKKVKLSCYSHAGTK